MATEAQRKASRENGKKSNGPRTAEGKARSSKNAIKHGLLARDAVTADEDPAEYDRQFQLLEENLFPKNAIEFALVRQIADAEWRLQRITRIEAGFATAKYSSTDRHTRQFHPKTVLPERDGENQLLGKSMDEQTQKLTNFARYRTLASRDIMRALKMIRQLRKDEYECKENRAANGAIHRPTLTDPDPYTTPDPMEPQPPRYEPPAAAAQTSNPIGFRADTRSTPSAQTTSSVQPNHQSRITNHDSRITGHESRPRVQVHKRTQAPLKTNSLSPAEAQRTNYGTRHFPATPVPSLLAAEATRS